MSGLDFFLCVYLGFVVCVFFHVSLDHFVLVLLAFVVLGFVSSILNQEIHEERLRNGVFCVEWDVKPLLNQTVSQPVDSPVCIRNVDLARQRREIYRIRYDTIQ